MALYSLSCRPSNMGFHRTCRKDSKSDRTGIPKMVLDDASAPKCALAFGSASWDTKREAAAWQNANRLYPSTNGGGERAKAAGLFQA